MEDIDIMATQNDLEFEIYHALTGAYLTAINTVLYAYKAGEGDLQGVARNAYETYQNVLMLQKLFEVRGFTTVPEDHWLDTQYYGRSFGDFIDDVQAKEDKILLVDDWP